MKCFIGLVMLVTITHSKGNWVDDIAVDDTQLHYFSDEMDNLVDLETHDDEIENWGHLYENANDIYYDEQKLNMHQSAYQEYDDDYDYDYDDDYDYDYDDIYYDDLDQHYKSMNWMNAYFDQLDEFYYNNYRLHTSYDNFENMDFSEVLQENMDSADEYDDDMGIQDLLSSLDADVEEWPDLAKLAAEEAQKQSETPETKHLDTKTVKKTANIEKKGSDTHPDDILDTASKNHMVITMILRSYMMYLRTAAHLQGRMKGIKGLKPLSTELQTLCKGDFGTLDMSQIRVAMGVNTLHGNPVTFGIDIFFPRIIDPKQSESDLEMLLTQLKYAQMYTETGGVWPFLEKYVINVCKDHNDCEIFKRIVRQRSLDLMEVVHLDEKTENQLKLELVKIWHQYASLGSVHDAL